MKDLDVDEWKWLLLFAQSLRREEIPFSKTLHELAWVSTENCRCAVFHFSHMALVPNERVMSAI